MGGVRIFPKNLRASLFKLFRLDPCLWAVHLNILSLLKTWDLRTFLWKRGACPRRRCPKRPGRGPAGSRTCLTLSTWSTPGRSFLQPTKYLYIKSTKYVPSPELGLSHPLSCQRVCPSPRNQRGGEGSTLACGWGVGGSQFRRLEKSLALCLLYAASLQLCKKR